MPVRERPPSLCPSLRPSLRKGFEHCERSEQDILQNVFDAYFDNVDEDMLRKNNAGRTLMVQDLMNKWSFEHILGIFDDLGAEHVEYVFLPLSAWETKKKSLRESSKSKNNARNKSYCFLHFSDVAACEAFADRVMRYELPDEERSDGADIRVKKMRTSLSATQGVVPNLLRLMDIHNRRWHPRAGALALRLGDSFAPVNIAALRKFLQGILKEDPMTAPGCLQKHCTLSIFFEETSRPPVASEAA